MRSLAFIGGKEYISKVLSIAQSEGIEASSIEELDTEISRFESPINLAHINEVLTTVSLVFSSGSAAVAFVEKLRELLRKESSGNKQHGAIEVRDAMTNAHAGLITSDGSLDRLKSTILGSQNRSD